MKRKAPLIAACLFLVVLVGYAPAEASDSKFFPGIVCTKDTARGTWTRYFGTVANSSSADGLDLVCPLLRDTTGIQSATVQMFARSKVDVYPGCELHFEFASGAGVWGSSDWQVTPLPNSPNVQTINYGAQTGGDYYYAVCFLNQVYAGAGGWSHVVRFAITEP